MKQENLIVKLFVIVFISFLYSCSNPENNLICKDYSDFPVSSLSEDLIREMVVGYRSNQLRHINSAMSGYGMNEEEFTDSQIITFDLESIKKFIYHIETNQQIMSLDENKTLQLAFLYSKYPSFKKRKISFDEELRNLPPDYSDRHTLIIMPGYVEDGKNYIMKIPDTTNNMSHGSPPTNEVRYIIALTIEGKNTSALNHGSLIPPRTIQYVDEDLND